MPELAQFIRSIRPAPLGSVAAGICGLSKRRVVETAYGKFLVSPVSHLGYQLSHGGYEPAMTAALGMHLRQGDVFVDQFCEAAVTDPHRMALAGKVEVLHDPAITARGARLRHMVRVDVQFADGSLESETVEAARGSEQKFASEADVVEKFRKLARRSCEDARAERIV